MAGKWPFYRNGVKAKRKIIWMMIWRKAWTKNVKGWKVSVDLTNIVHGVTQCGVTQLYSLFYEGAYNLMTEKLWEKQMTNLKVSLFKRASKENKIKNMFCSKSTLHTSPSFPICGGTMN